MFEIDVALWPVDTASAFVCFELVIFYGVELFVFELPVAKLKARSFASSEGFYWIHAVI